MPPDCPTCLLEFTEPSEARTASRSLAYINFNGNPLYLEWAPEDAFTKPADKSQKVSQTAAKAPEAAQQTKPKPEMVEEKSNSTGSDMPLEENSTLFVKNLNFMRTTEQKSGKNTRPSRAIALVMSITSCSIT